MCCNNSNFSQISFTNQFKKVCSNERVALQKIYLFIVLEIYSNKPGLEARQTLKGLTIELDSCSRALKVHKSFVIGF